MLARFIKILIWFRDFFLITWSGWLFVFILFYRFPAITFLRLAGDHGVAWAVGICFGVAFMLCSCVSGFIYYVVTGRNGIDVIVRMEWPPRYDR